MLFRFLFPIMFFIVLLFSFEGKSQNVVEYIPEIDGHPEDEVCLDFYQVEERYIYPKKGIEKVWGDFSGWCKNNGIATRLDAGISLSTLGLGLEVATSMTKWADLRFGVDWMPRFGVPLKFNLNTYAEGIPTGSFHKVQSLLYDMTGIEIDEVVNMKGHGSMVNFKFMVDVFPFQTDRRWHFTAGFYAGTSRIADAINDIGEKPTLVGLNIYNRAYEYFTTLEDIYDVPIGGGAYLDWEIVEKLQARFRSYGRMGIQIGDFKDGKPYVMEPAPDGTVSASAFVNHFKPYLGAGFSTPMDLEERWHFSIDIGAVFWGGAPDVINKDWRTGRNINFTKDLVNIRGKVGTYMKAVKALPVYPMVALRFSYTLL